MTMLVVNSVLPVFLVIAVGLALDRAGMITEAVRGGLNRIAYWVCLPALLFYKTAEARVTGGLPGVMALVAAGLGIATVGTFWALGLVYRLRDMRAAALMQLTLFFGLFLTEAQTPIPLMSGWLPTVARFNPLNQVLRLARVGFVGDPRWADAWPGLLTLTVLAVLAGLFARRGLAALDD